MADDKATPGNGLDDPGLGDAYGLKTPDDNRALYRSWAHSYESGFVADHAYRYHDAIAALCRDHLTATAPHILDVGCGTGLVGQALRGLLPVAVIDGLDISPEMMAVAEGKGIYRTLFERDLTAPIDMPVGYDAVVSAGTFTHGHVGPEALPALIDTANNGGLFVLGVNAEFFAKQGFETMIARLVADGRITVPEMIEGRVYGSDADHEHASDRFLALVFRVTAQKWGA